MTQPQERLADMASDDELPVVLGMALPGPSQQLDRRQLERRTRDAVPEPLSRRAERRGDDRRDSPRREIALDVREPRGKPRACMGDLSVGGASFITAVAPVGEAVELMFTLPTYAGPLVASAVVVGRRPVEKGIQVSVVFTDLDVEAELAIAQWFDEA